MIYFDLHYDVQVYLYLQIWVLSEEGGSPGSRILYKICDIYD